MSREGGDALLAALAPHLTQPCLLAVSGGPDSTALLHAAAAARGPAALHAATVDHGLRPEARDEAEAVARQAEALGIPHTILTWAPDGPPPGTGIQAAARTARYRLLAARAAEVGAARLLTAHTRDDQAETVLMRLCAGSGPAGLAGMRPERDLGAGLTLARPFLHLAKASLVAWCEARGAAYLRDPSNRDERFARARLRRVLPLLAAEGLTVERLVRLAERAARDDAALDRLAADALARLTRAGEARSTAAPSRSCPRRSPCGCSTARSTEPAQGRGAWSVWSASPPRSCPRCGRAGRCAAPSGAYWSRPIRRGRSASLRRPRGPRSAATTYLATDRPLPTLGAECRIARSAGRGGPHSLRNGR